MSHELTPGSDSGRAPAREERRSGPPPSRQGPAAPSSGSDLRYYWEVLVRRWPLIAGVTLVLVLGTAVGTLLTPSEYRATGLLEIRRGDADMEQPQELFRQQNVTDEYLQTQYGILESSALARRVAESLRLDTVPLFAPEGSETGGGLLGPLGVALGSALPTGSSSSRESPPEADPNSLRPIVEKVEEGLGVDPREGSRLVRVSFQTEDPELSAEVVNAALNSYVQMRVQSGEEVVTWLSRQVDSTKAKLRAAERQLRQYASEHDLPVLETADGQTRNVVDQRLRKLEEELTSVRANRIDAESRYRQVVEQDNYQAVDNQVIQDLTVELASLRKKYARLTSVFQEEYPKARQVERQIEELERQLEKEKQRVADRLRSEYRVAQHREEMLQAAVDSQRTVARRMADESGEYRILRREVEANRKLLSAIQQTKKEADVSAALRATRFGIVDMATPPLDPVGPGLKQNLALALLAGLVLGVGGAFVRERFDESVRSAEEVDAVVGAPLLALIPSADGNGAGTLSRQIRTGLEQLPAGPGDGSGGRPEGWPRIDASDASDVPAGREGPVAESFEALRAELFLGDGDQPAPRSLLVTSCQPREGKTTVSLNLALSLASSGRRTLLVDADLRRPSLHSALDVDGAPGLWEHLTGEVDWPGLTRSVGRENLHVLPAGRTTGDASEALASSRMREFLADAERHYDCVILDSLALFLNAADARILGSLVDGVVVVVRSGVTPRALAQRVMEKAPNVRGVVLNDLRESDLPGYYSDYFYGYGSEDSDRNGNGDPPADAGPSVAGRDGQRSGDRASTPAGRAVAAGDQDSGEPGNTRDTRDNGAQRQ